MRISFNIIIFCIIFTTQFANSQSKLSLLAGGYYNGNFLNEDASGIGLSLGLDYELNPNISVELRARYGYYSFDDGTKWKSNDDGTWSSPQNTNKPRIEYKLYSPKIGIVPKYHLSLDDFFDGISVFLENAFSVGLMTGTFEYNGLPYAKKSFTEPIFCYNIGLGIEMGREFTKWKFPFQVSFAFSTLNFRKKIIKHQPENYQGWIPDQSALFVFNGLFKIPFRKK